ncbi:MAG: hypothetical protein DRN96_04810 [Thermoproteota archaeon]|nr:MAG: hypothetical protein DRN96_04810 [Candidatus Korarchaeota archaeon]
MKPRDIASSIVFGGLTLALELAGLGHILHFPPLSYLIFDPCEVLVVAAYFIFGFTSAALATLVLVLGLSINMDPFSQMIMASTGIPAFGPLMKGLAILSTLAGMWAVSRKVNPSGSIAGVAAYMASPMAVRALAMTPPNYLFIKYIVVRLPLPQETISWFLESMSYILVMTAVFNVLHVLLTVGLALVLYKAVKPALRGHLQG